MRSLIDALNRGVDLGSRDVEEAVALLLSDSVTAETKADFLSALHRKGETAKEIASFARVLLERAVPLPVDQSVGPIMDICGTGGDGIDLFNVSTATMFLLAAGGVTVLKHGNRAVTSRSGSADVLEQLGIRIELEADDLRRCVEKLGIGFVYARIYHPTFRALAQMRGQLRGKHQRTIFSLVGPLLNPAHPQYQVMGTFSAQLTSRFAEVMRQLGRARCWVINGSVSHGASIDEVSTLGPTTIAELNKGRISSAILDTRWLGIAAPKLEEVIGGDAKSNAEIIMAILDGSDRGPRYDLLVANAAAGFVVAGLAEEMNGGIALAREQIASGRAMRKLRALREFA